MDIDWMLLLYLIVGFCAIIGFFRGWWKEAITLFVLALLVVLLQRPDWAQKLIDGLNWLITESWSLLYKVTGLALGSGPYQFDATKSGTWIIVLVILVGAAALIAHLILPGNIASDKGRYYVVEGMGRLIGLVFGGVNGFLIINLLREYLDGRALPGRTAPSTEIAVVGGSAFGPASSTLSIQAVNLPSFTILDSYIPWLIIGFGLLLGVAAVKSRYSIVSKAGAGSKIEYTSPYGYKRIDRKPSPPERPMKVEVANPS
jgi:hypothetical protein